MNELSQLWQSILELNKLPKGQNIMEVQLRVERLLNAAILAASADAILICDHTGRIIRHNQQLADYGYEELKGTYIWDSVLAQQDIKRAKELFYQVKSYSDSLVLKEQYVSDTVLPDGEHRVFSWTVMLFLNETGLASYVIWLGRDITEQWMIEERLRKSNAELDSIFENVNGVIYGLSTDGEFIFASQGWTEALGWDTSEVKGWSFERFVHPDSIPRCRRGLSEIITTGELKNHVEYQIKHKDGSWRWHSSSGAVVKDEDGKPQYYIGLAVDITEKKKAESALNLSEDKFSKVFLSNPDPMTLTSLAEGYLIEINDAWIKATGYERHEALGRTGTDLGIWIFREERAQMLKHIQEQGTLRNYKIKHRNKSRKIRDYLVSAEIIDIGDTPYLLCVYKDVTDSTRGQETLRLSEERFSKAFNASPATMSISTMQDGRYIDVNDSFCSIIGYSREEIVGRTSSEMGFWVDAQVRKKIVQSLLIEPVRDLEINFRRKFGEQRLGLYSGEQIEINGESCLLSIVTDITERKQSEEEIKYLSFHDKLTDLYNRAFFEEELKRLDIAQGFPLSIIMGDVNGLKLVNDAFGHHEGDKLLITVAEILKEFCREEDVVARWGGDEFIVLLPGCDGEAAARVFNRIKHVCKRIDGLPFQTSMSLGLASKTFPFQNTGEIIKEAEDKMYRNKLLENRSARSTFLTSLEKTLWTRSHETRDHCQRMQEIARSIGEAISLPDSEMDDLILLAALHDIGKIAIPNNILDKPGNLSPEEWEVVKKHPETGYRIAMSSPDMVPIAEAILHHHERWDGTGYPLGIKGNKIPLISRIIAIADIYDVMINGRPYQYAVSLQETKQEIDRCAGSQFDPQLVKVALEVL